MGRPVALVIRLNDGRTMAAETTWALFDGTARAPAKAADTEGVRRTERRPRSAPGSTRCPPCISELRLHPEAAPYDDRQARTPLNLVALAEVALRRRVGELEYKLRRQERWPDPRP